MELKIEQWWSTFETSNQQLKARSPTEHSAQKLTDPRPDFFPVLGRDAKGRGAISLDRCSRRGAGHGMGMQITER